MFSRSTSESDGLEKWLSPALEIEAGDLRWEIARTQLLPW